VTSRSQSARGRARDRRGAAKPREAAGDVAQRYQSSVGGPLRRVARHPGARLADAPPRPRRVAALRTGPRDHPAHQSLPGRSPGDGLAVVAGASGPPPLGGPTTAGRSSSSTRN
jgi:hypothetical protein